MKKMTGLFIRLSLISGDKRHYVQKEEISVPREMQRGRFSKKLSEPGFMRLVRSLRIKYRSIPTDRILHL
jgi:hypothetical protein